MDSMCFTCGRYKNLDSQLPVVLNAPQLRVEHLNVEARVYPMPHLLRFCNVVCRGKFIQNIDECLSHHRCVYFLLSLWEKFYEEDRFECPLPFDIIDDFGLPGVYGLATEVIDTAHVLISERYMMENGNAYVTVSRYGMEISPVQQYRENFQGHLEEWPVIVDMAKKLLRSEYEIDLAAHDEGMSHPELLPRGLRREEPRPLLPPENDLEELEEDQEYVLWNDDDEEFDLE